MSKYCPKWWMMLALCVLVFIFWLTVDYNVNRIDVRACFDYNMYKVPVGPQRMAKLGDLQLLDNILHAEPKPSDRGHSIIFHQTSCRRRNKHNRSSRLAASREWKMVHLTARQACAIESAALHHRNYSVFVLFTSPAYRVRNNSSPLVEAILSYSNVHLRNLNLWTYAAGTPVYEWLKGGALFKSSYVLSHLSDFLRYLTLWRWGGIYMDLDVVVLRSLELLPPNYSGTEAGKDIAAGVMNFSPYGFGHEVAEKCLLDFVANFDGSNWGKNGPGVITRIINSMCELQNVDIMFNVKRCMRFHILPRDAFYAIHWSEWEHFFEVKYLNETMEALKYSYVAHVWNKYSSNRRIEVGSNSAYGKLAEEHCPKVYAASGDYF